MLVFQRSSLHRLLVAAVTAITSLFLFQTGPSLVPDAAAADPPPAACMVVRHVCGGPSNPEEVPMFNRSKPPGSPLDEPLLHWTKLDPFTFRDLVKSVFIMGQSGSGKSTGSGFHLARSLVRHGNTSGLVLSSKPEDLEVWTRLFTDAGRLDDLIVIEPRGKYRCNVFDYELKHGADTRQLAQCAMVLSESLNKGEANGGSRDPFFKAEAYRQLFNAFEIVKSATGKADPWELQLFISGAARSAAELSDPKWQAGVHSQTIAKAHARPKDTIESHDHRLGAQYWLNELPLLNDRTRSSIEAGVMGTLHAVNTGIVRDLVASTTNTTPDVMEERKWWLVNMPIVAGDMSATFINTSLKYIYQRAILRRKAKSGDPFSTIWTDEYQKVSNSFDAAFLAECRSHLGCMVALTQSIHSVYEAVGGPHHHAAEALLTNFATKIAHTLGDAKSAEYCSSLLGSRLEAMSGGGEEGGGGMADDIFGGKRFKGSFSSSYQPVIQPSVFLSGLRSGGKDGIVDGIVIKTGQPFSNGENYLKVEFEQERA